MILPSVFFASDSSFHRLKALQRSSISSCELVAAVYCDLELSTASSCRPRIEVAVLSAIVLDTILMGPNQPLILIHNK